MSHLVSLCRSAWQPVAVWLPALWSGPVSKVPIIICGSHWHQAEVRWSREPVRGSVHRGGAAEVPGPSGAHSRGSCSELPGQQRSAALWHSWGPHPRAVLEPRWWQENERHWWVLLNQTPNVLRLEQHLILLKSSVNEIKVILFVPICLTRCISAFLFFSSGRDFKRRHHLVHPERACSLLPRFWKICMQSN